MENPPKKFFRLSPGAEVRLRYAYFVTCREVVKNAAGEVIELRCTYDPATKGGNAPDGRKVKATIHWVSAAHSLPAEVRLYNPLFTKPDPAGGENFAADLNPNSLEVLSGARVEPAAGCEPIPSEPVQFERQGYFCRDRGLHARHSRCSTAPSACATPGPRRRRGPEPVSSGMRSERAATVQGSDVALTLRYAWDRLQRFTTVLLVTTCA